MVFGTYISCCNTLLIDRQDFFMSESVSHCCSQIPDRKQLKGDRVDLGSELEGWKGLAPGMGCGVNGRNVWLLAFISVDPETRVEVRE